MFPIEEDLFHRLSDVRTRRIPRIVATLAIVAASLAAPFTVVRAYGEVGDLACTVAGQMNFTPPLTATNTTSEVSQPALAFNCISPNGSYPDLKAGIGTLSGSATSAGGLNPCSVLVTLEIGGRITWSPTGQHSRAEFLINTNPSAGSITATGTVTNGVLAGDSITFVGALVPNADCAVNGLSSLVFEGEDFIN